VRGASGSQEGVERGWRGGWVQGQDYVGADWVHLRLCERFAIRVEERLSADKGGVWNAGDLVQIQAGWLDELMDDVIDTR
jgi:hypothetical protein